MFSASKVLNSFKPLRPKNRLGSSFQGTQKEEKMIKLAIECWSMSPEQRPRADEIVDYIKLTMEGKEAVLPKVVSIESGSKSLENRLMEVENELDDEKKGREEDRIAYGKLLELLGEKDALLEENAKLLGEKNKVITENLATIEFLKGQLRGKDNIF